MNNRYIPPGDWVIGVSSVEDVKAFPMPVNTRFAFFSTGDDDICWIKSTDSAGNYSIISFDMTKREEPSEFITRKEFNELKSMLQEVLDEHVVSDE